MAVYSNAARGTMDMNVRRNYWVYSAGLAVVWAALLIAIAIARASRLDTFLLVFGGFAIAWVSGTIARYVYPPPRKWFGTG